AAGTLAAETLRVGSVSEQHSDKVPEGRITKMDPAPGTRVKRETPIDIVVSKGPAPVAMPKVAGLSTAKATKALDAAGLLINRTEEYSDSVPADTVIRSTPTTGTMIHRQDTVAIVVSKGPPPVPVPDVVRLGTAEAKAKLQAAGFHVVVRNQLPVVMFNRVYSQYPGGGSQAPRGSTITINIV
ncbi:MAG: PASTA domain-containing protein, partial [Candidatus Nanopelagicales bacterium]|nr:PASTA domain-containing protein [Candidatus Nanopelagicales bacterium]